MKIAMIYGTAADEAEAIKLAEMLVQSKAAACVNILGKTTSIYEWAEKLERSDEVAFLIKTTPELVEEAVRLVKSAHSYECPALISWSSEQGNPNFFNWVARQVNSNHSPEQ